MNNRYIRVLMLYFGLLLIYELVSPASAICAGLATIINDVFEAHKDLIEK